MIVAQKTWKHVSKYEDVIRARNDEFFMESDFGHITQGEEPLEQTIVKLRGMWAVLSPHNRKIVWDFVNNIASLAKLCAAQ
jgi:hypothetical protein